MGSIQRCYHNRSSGKIEFEGVIENVTYKIESDEATGLREIIIIESKDKTKSLRPHPDRRR